MQSFIHGRGALLLLLVFSLSIMATPTWAHNITDILSPFHEFSTFNDYLTLTHLSDVINSRQTITVLAIDDGAMNDLIAVPYYPEKPLSTIKNVLSLHVLLDYFDSKKLHQLSSGTALAATLFQATGAAAGDSGLVNITVLKGGKVAFAAKDAPFSSAAVYVKSVKEIPYNISVLQVSRALSSPSAEAPAPAPEVGFPAVMSDHGCKLFADALTANSDALKTFKDNIEGGLTVFCPTDDAFKKFTPKFENLTSDDKSSLLLYHGVPLYESIAMLRSNNGLMNTLATDGAKKFDFTVQNDGQDVTLKTTVVTARVTGTLADQQPLAIHSVDKVLLPVELFKADIAPAPAPETVHSHASPPAPTGYIPTSSADSPADGPTADDRNDGGRRESGLWIGRLALSVGLSATWVVGMLL